jgi:hypothetical protein
MAVLGRRRIRGSHPTSAANWSMISGRHGGCTTRGMVIVSLVPALVAVGIFVATLRLGTDPADTVS